MKKVAISQEFAERELSHRYFRIIGLGHPDYYKHAEGARGTFGTPCMRTETAGQVDLVLTFT